MPGPPDRALRHAGDRLPHLHALQRRPAEGQRHHRPRGRRDGAAHPRRAGRRRAERRGRRDRGAAGPACISATTPTPRPTTRRSRRTAGSAPATSAGASTRRATCEIVGRRKEIINRGGKKFFPREVEEILYTHPKIMHAAMVGVADQRLGERNCLCVIPKAGQSVTLAEMIAHPQGPGGRLQAARGDAHRRGAAVHGDRQAEAARAHRLDRQGAGGWRTQAEALASQELCFSPLAARRGMRATPRSVASTPGAGSLTSSSRVRKCGTFRERTRNDLQATLHASRRSRRHGRSRRLALCLDQRSGAGRRRHQDRHARRPDRPARLGRPADRSAAPSSTPRCRTQRAASSGARSSC